MNYVLDPTKLELTLKKNKIHTWHFKEDTLHFGANVLHVNAETEHLCFTGEQLVPFKRERVLKGSGQLELRVIRDGPRRVLQILDVVQVSLLVQIMKLIKNQSQTMPARQSIRAATLSSLPTGATFSRQPGQISSPRESASMLKCPMALVSAPLVSTFGK